MTAPGPSANNNLDDTSNIHLRVTVEDAPPPYSETDIYSAPASSAGQRSPHLAAAGPADDAASRVSSTEAGDAIVYTPPQTPRLCSNSHTLNIPPSPSANLYFDDHPAPPAAGSERVSAPIVHKVSIGPESKPGDLPYPAEWAVRDVSQQDWATFVNFLIPHHDTEVNEAIFSEKVRSDDIAEIRGEKTPTEGSVRSSQTVDRMMNDRHEVARRRAEIEATVQQWNDGFFVPRGVQILLEPVEEEPHVPGAWDSAFDRAPPASGTAEAGPSSQREATDAPPPHPQGRGGWRGGFGGFRIDNDSVRWGDSFVADSNGLRIGNLVMDNNGIRMNGRGGGMPSGPNTRGMPGFPPHTQYTYPGPSPGPGPWGPHRGRSEGPHPAGARSRSSSVSSSSSSSSSDSDSDASTIGSLPDYDDLQDQQLPVFVERLKSWTASPNQVRTEADVKQLRAELKASKNNRNGPAISDMDRNQLRAQIKALKKQWRTLKKQQRKERKVHRKERKQKRKEERKEKKQRKKEFRKSKKEIRRGHRGHHAPPPPPGPAPVHVPEVQVPPVPAVPPVPPPFGGQGSGWGWGWGDSRGARGGCGGASGGRGGFFGAHGPSIPALDRNNPNGPFGPNGPLGQHGPLGQNGPLGQHGPLGQNGPLGPHGPLGPNGVFGTQGMFGPRGSRGRAGRGCGRGGRGWFPGAWPEDTQGADRQAENTLGEDFDLPPPGPVSAEKYRTVDSLEEQIKAKQANLPRVSDSQRRAVEKELEALVEKLDNLRTEADEAYARELQSGEGQYHAGNGY